MLDLGLFPIRDPVSSSPCDPRSRLALFPFRCSLWNHYSATHGCERISAPSALRPVRPTQTKCPQVRFAGRPGTDFVHDSFTSPLFKPNLTSPGRSPFTSRPEHALREHSLDHFTCNHCRPFRAAVMHVSNPQMIEA